VLALVTGSTGFIGSHLCHDLLAKGDRVRAFHRPNSPLTLLEGLEVEHAIGDILEPETLKRAMQGVEVVFHAAAQLGGAGKDPTYASTVQGTRNLMAAAAKAGVRRVVHTSSVAALGVPKGTNRGANRMAVDENHTWNYSPQGWPYGYAKYRAEMEVQAAAASGLDVVIVNPAVVIGAGDINRIGGEVILYVARGRLPIYPAGGLNAVHVDDVVRGHLAALEHGQTGKRYILGNQNLTHRQFLGLIAEVAGVQPPRISVPAWFLRTLAWPVSILEGKLRLQHLPIDASSLQRAGYYFYYDTRLAHQELALPEPLPVRQAITEALEWYRQRGIKYRGIVN
jgi:dihydroflavonol-4-reductase